jgi:hypothetical protein
MTSEFEFHKMLCEDAKTNEFLLKQDKQIGESYNLVIELWNFCFEVEIECSRKNLSSLSAMLLFVVEQRLCSMMNALLLGDIPACYMFMRVILEGVVDGVVASIRVPDLPFPKNFEWLKEIEDEKHFSFNDKCKLLLPSWVSNETKEKCYKLWKELSEYWVHANGTIKKLQKRYEEETKNLEVPPMWALALPCTYNVPGTNEVDEDSRADLKELAYNLKELSLIVKEILNGLL